MKKEKTENTSKESTNQNHRFEFRFFSKAGRNSAPALHN